MGEDPKHWQKNRIWPPPGCRNGFPPVGILFQSASKARARFLQLPERQADELPESGAGDHLLEQLLPVVGGPLVDCDVEAVQGEHLPTITKHTRVSETCRVEV